MKLVKEHIKFERGLPPKVAMGIGLPSKMGPGFEPLFNDGDWSIEKYLNKNTNKNSLIVVSDGYDDNDGHVPCVTDYPILYNGGNISFDNPWRIPEYVKEKVRELYPIINEIKEHIKFERGLAPKKAMGIGLLNVDEYMISLGINPENFWNDFQERDIKDLYELLKQFVFKLVKEKIITKGKMKFFLGEPKNQLKDGDRFNLYGSFYDIIISAPISIQRDFMKPYIESYLEF